MRQPNECNAPDISYVDSQKECASSNSKILGFVYIRSNLWISGGEFFNECIQSRDVLF